MSDLTKLTTQQLVARGVKAPALTALLDDLGGKFHIDASSERLAECRAELAALTAEPSEPRDG
jgi:hypothetical protein